MKIVVLCMAACLLAGGSSFAQSPDSVIPGKLSLSEALRIADERSPALASARALVAMAGADLVTARTRPNPALTFDSEGYPLFAANRPGLLNGQEMSLRVDQEIEMGGRLRLRAESADAARRSAQALLQDGRRRLFLDVRRAYFQLVLAKADQDAAKASLDEMDRVITVNRARLEQGEISGGELRRLQVERLRFMDDVFNAELAARNGRSTLLALMNAPRLDVVFDTTEPLAPPATTIVAEAAARPGPANPAEAGSHVPVPATGVSGSESRDQGKAGALQGDRPDGAALAREALAQRADLAAARGDEARADSETRLQRALRTPNLTIGGGYKRDFGDSGLIVGMTVPLPLFNKNAGGIARAEAERQLAASRVAATEVAVALDVQQAINAVEISRARVEYIEKEHLQNAREARDIVLASYGAGALDLTDFLDAQRAFRETQRTYNRALYDYRISLFELDAAVGRQ
jgi:cobalt-zinc-cadmium efflux system outer membrane protein